MFNRSPRFGGLAAVVMCLLAESASAAERTSAGVFYVRTGGDDAADGHTPATAFATIRRAAAALANPGDQVIVGPGSYNEGDISPAWNGIEGHLVQFLADSRGMLTGDAAGPVTIVPTGTQSTGFLILGHHHIVIDGFTIVGASDAGIQVRTSPRGVDSADISIRNTEVRAGAKRGIDVTATGRVELVANLAIGNGSTGMVIAGAGTPVFAALSNNQSSRNGSHGIFVSGAAGGSLDGNETADNVEFGVLVRASADLSIRDNSVLRNRDGLSVLGSGLVACTDNSVSNNQGVGISIEAETSASVRVDISRNHIQQNSGTGIFLSGAAGGIIADNDVARHHLNGINVRHSEHLSVFGNVISDSGGSGLAIGVATEPAGIGFAVADNEITDSLKAGITAFAHGAFVARGNRVTHSGSTGLSLSGSAVVTPQIANNTIGTSGAHGIFVQNANGGVVQNNICFSNGDTGMTVRAARHISVINNLVYANASDGVGLGTADRATPDSTFINNTVYGNGGWGLVMGTSAAASAGATVLNNIFHTNGTGGIAIARSSTCGYVAGFNINDDGYGEGTPRNTYDLAVDPLLVNPAGADGVLGGDGFADDDFHLQQPRGGQLVRSPGADAGSAAIAAFGLGGGTAVGDLPDIGIIDIGFHYGVPAERAIVVPTPYMPFFVRQSGDDARDGHSAGAALASIQEAARRAAAGGTVVVGPGRYAEGDLHPLENLGPTAFFADSNGASTDEVPGAVVVDASGRSTGFTLLAACNSAVDGFYVTGAQDAGIQVRSGSPGARIRNNVAFSNLRRGIEVLGADAAAITNNLVYANGTGGIRVSGGNNSDVINNTVYANTNDGILVGGSGDDEAALGMVVLRNIVVRNGDLGIKVEPNSFAGYFTGFNVVFGVTPFAGNTPRADSDFVTDPLFVNPAGADGILGAEGFRDDDFHLLHDPIGTSPAVDLDFAEMDVLSAGSTRQDGFPDLGPLDAGYHYGFLPRQPQAQPMSKLVYVRTTGDDHNSGALPNEAFASISAAIGAVVGGGMVVVGPGTYAITDISVSGMGYIVLLGDENGTATGDAPGRVVLHWSSGAGLVLGGAVLVDGITVQGQRGPGVRILRRARDVTLRNSTVCGNAGDGVVSDGDGVTVINNLICGNDGNGIALRLRRVHGATRLLNNSVTGNGRTGVAIREIGATSHAMVMNNILSGNAQKGVTAFGIRGSAPAIAYNVNTDGYRPAALQGAQDLVVDPQFSGGPAQTGRACDAANEYRLLSASAAVDAGVGTAAELGLAGRAATLDETADVGATDLGFHYLWPR